MVMTAHKVDKYCLQLMLSLWRCPKVITLRGLHCTWNDALSIKNKLDNKDV